MKRLMTLMLLSASLVLPACGDFKDVGPKTKPSDANLTLSPEVEEDCDHPDDYLHIDDWEIMAGRLGDALYECRGEKRIAVDAFNGVVDTLN